MTKLGISAAMILGVAGVACASDAWAADVMPTKATPPAAALASEPVPCTAFWDFIATNCPLTWQGITVYGTLDVGGGWQSHGAPFDSRFPTGASYYIQKMNRSAMWGLAPNAMQQSSVGIRGKEPIAGDVSFVFAVDAGFNPYSLQLSNGPGSLSANAGIPLNQQSVNGDSSRAGQWFNGVGYVGLSSPSYGTLTVFRQNSLTFDGAINYDPMGVSYAFSPLGFSGITCGVGNTEACRFSTSVKYRIDVGQFRAAALWQFGGYAQNNGSNGAYQVQVGADIPNLANGVLSVDAIYSYVRDVVSLSLGGGSNDAAGMPIAPFLPQTLTATFSDNSSVMLLGKYAVGPLKLYAGYEWIHFAAPSNPQTAFTDIGGHFICDGCAAVNNTDISNTAYGTNGLGNKTLQVMWIGARYAVKENLDVMTGYYHYIQNSFFGTAAGGPAPCSDSSHSQCAGTFDGISFAVDWRFAPKWDLYAGVMFTQVTGGLANGYLQRNNVDPTVGLRFRF